MAREKRPEGQSGLERFGIGTPQATTQKRSIRKKEGQGQDVASVRMVRETSRPKARAEAFEEYSRHCKTCPDCIRLRERLIAGLPTIGKERDTGDEGD